MCFLLTMVWVHHYRTGVTISWQWYGCTITVLGSPSLGNGMGAPLPYWGDDLLAMVWVHHYRTGVTISWQWWECTITALGSSSLGNGMGTPLPNSGHHLLAMVWVHHYHTGVDISRQCCVCAPLPHWGHHLFGNSVRAVLVGRDVKKWQEIWCHPLSHISQFSNCCWRWNFRTVWSFY